LELPAAPRQAAAERLCTNDGRGGIVRRLEAKDRDLPLRPDELGYWSANASRWIQEVAAFDIWVGADSLTTLHADFEIVR